MLTKYDKSLDKVEGLQLKYAIFNGFLFSDFKYLMAYSIPLTALTGLYLGGYWLFTTPIYIFVIIPAVEFILTHYGIDELETRRAEKGIHWLFDLMLYLNILIVFGLLIYSLTKIVSFEFISITSPALSTFPFPSLSNLSFL